MTQSSTPEADAAPTRSRGGSGSKHCPTCKGPLVEHGEENEFKAGAYHCNNCGICWNAELTAPR